MNKCSAAISAAIVAWIVGAGTSFAGEADVVGATARQGADGRWDFSVTVRHADAGWDHYADRWDVLSPDGAVLGSRKLLHPHDNEQPFTRSLTGVSVPEGVTRVILRAHDTVHGLGGAEFSLELDRPGG